MAEQNTLEGFRADAVSAGLTGAIRRADVGAPIPVGMGKYDTDTHTNLGYVSNDGVTEGRDDAKEGYTPWQETEEIRSDYTKKTTWFEFILWQSTEGNITYFYGVHPDDIFEESDGSWGFYEGTDLAEDESQICCDVIDGQQLRRTIMAKAEIVERGDINYRRGALIGYKVKVKAKVGPEGWSVKRLYKNLVDLDGTPSTPPPVIKIITITGGPTGGTYPLKFGGLTADVAPGATAAQIRTALEGLSSIGAGNVSVTGSTGGPFTVTLDGDLVGTLTTTGNGAAQLTGGTNPTVVVS